MWPWQILILYKGRWKCLCMLKFKIMAFTDIAVVLTCLWKMNDFSFLGCDIYWIFFLLSGASKNPRKTFLYHLLWKVQLFGVCMVTNCCRSCLFSPLDYSDQLHLRENRRNLLFRQNAGFFSCILIFKDKRIHFCMDKKEKIPTVWWWPYTKVKNEYSTTTVQK